MKKSVILLIACLILFSMPVLAEESDPGVLPGSFWYSFDRFFEKVHLAITFDSAKKARLHLDYAGERSAEASAEMENENFRSAESILNDYNYELVEARKEMKDVEGEEKDELSSDIKILTSESKLTLQTIYEGLEDEERLRPDIRNYPHNATIIEEEKLRLKKELAEDLEKKFEEMEKDLEDFEGP